MDLGRHRHRYNHKHAVRLLCRHLRNRPVLTKIRQKYRLYTYERAAALSILKWMQVHAEPGDTVCFDLLTITSKQQISPSKSAPVSNSPQFLIVNEAAKLPPTYIIRFSYPGIIIAESPRELTGSKKLWRVCTTNTASIALRLARTIINSTFTDEPISSDSLPLWAEPLLDFSEPTRFDFALWYKGELRGSQVVSEVNLVQGIFICAQAVIRDNRFKPLYKDECDATTIELALCLGPLLPTYHSFAPERSPLGTHTYIIKTPKQESWYFPSTFATKKFTTHNEVCQSLALQKLKLSSDLVKQSRFYISQAVSYIDRPDTIAILPNTNSTLFSFSAISHAELYTAADAAADFLIRNQKSDGYIPTITSPYTRTQAGIDWVRLAFSAWSVYAYGQARDSDTYKDASFKLISFIESQSARVSAANQESLLLTLIYSTRWSLAVDRKEITDTLVAKFLAHTESLLSHTSPFTQLQALSLLQNLPQTPAQQHAYHTLLAKLVPWVREMMTSSELGDLVSVAEWYAILNSGLPDSPDDSCGFGDWFLDRCHDAFLDHAHNGYTRGIGKLFEVCATKSNNQERTLTLARWLTDNQYTEGSSYRFPCQLQSMVHGGFRHDAANHEVWIDSAAHFLLGAARVIKR
jgi:AMMECR1 domain-containing protein